MFDALTVGHIPFTMQQLRELLGLLQTFCSIFDPCIIEYNILAFEVVR